MLNDGVGCTVWNFRDTQFVRHKPLEDLEENPKILNCMLPKLKFLVQRQAWLNFRQPSFAQAPLDFGMSLIK